jgi:hypothetical protein
MLREQIGTRRAEQPLNASPSTVTIDTATQPVNTRIPTDIAPGM